MKLNEEEILKLIDNGYLIMNSHPNFNLKILNYSRKCQFEKYWNMYTLMCRGLIIDDNYNIIARPLKKFMNYEEHKLEEIPKENFEIYDKIDGSLGILFFYENEWQLATRGSFMSEQAIRGKDILKKYDISSLNKEYTYCFEIVYPENRIVCSYKEEKLILLAVINTKYGNEMSYSTIQNQYGKILDIVKKYDGIYDINELKLRNIPNEEGYVLKYENGFRIKIKFEEYCRLHSIVTNISNKNIWEYLRDGKNLNELIENTPDEFDQWVKNQIEYFNKKFMVIDSNSRDIFNEIYKSNMTKKEFANVALKYKESPILFKILDNKPYNHIIWKMIEPEYSKPFS